MEIVCDIAKALGLPLSEERNRLVKREYAPITEFIKLMHYSLDTHYSPYERETFEYTYSTAELEQLIVSHIKNTTQYLKESGKEPEEIIKSIGRGVAIKDNTVPAATSGAAFSGVIAACIATPGIGWGIGAAIATATGVASASNLLSAPNYGKLIPCLLCIHAIRKRTSKLLALPPATTIKALPEIEVLFD